MTNNDWLPEGYIEIAPNPEALSSTVFEYDADPPPDIGSAVPGLHKLFDRLVYHRGQPIVCLPAGEYFIYETLYIPTNIQLRPADKNDKPQFKLLAAEIVCCSPDEYRKLRSLPPERDYLDLGPGRMITRYELSPDILKKKDAK